VSIPTNPPQDRRLRVVVADDHRPMLHQLVQLLEADFEVVGTAADGAAALDAVTQAGPDIAVLDVAMPRMGGIAVAAQLRSAGAAVKIVFVTMYRDREFMQRALELGPVGYVAKDRLVMDLLPAIRAVESGQSFVSPSFA
jgi:DNA-binding NarL/FixJ family response regulator